MARGNKREKDRERAAARAAKGPKEGHSAPKVGGKNDDAAALAAKIAAKQKLKDEGKLKDKSNKGEKYVAKKKVESVVNPHTGKKDPAYSAKLAKRQ
mmetsp:Transcript_12958/g.41415  ORF Transcript_12958/g.41415 Transcript_12958/m.41415 type:complete len:97 (+) Transcript_12958:122-412(+)